MYLPAGPGADLELEAGGRAARRTSCLSPRCRSRGTRRPSSSALSSTAGEGAENSREQGGEGQSAQECTFAPGPTTARWARG